MPIQRKSRGQDDPGGLGKVGRDVIAVAEKRQRVGYVVAAAHQDTAAAAGAVAREEVASAVAHHPGLGQVDSQLAGGPQQHARRWFAFGRKNKKICRRAELLTRFLRNRVYYLYAG